MSDRHRLILLLLYQEGKPSWGGVRGKRGRARKLIENKVVGSKMVTKAFFLEDALLTRETT